MHYHQVKSARKFSLNAAFAVALVAACIVIAWFGKEWGNRFVHQTLTRIGERTGIIIELADIRPGLFEVKVDKAQSADQSIVLSEIVVRLGALPFSEEFLKPQSIAVGSIQVRVKPEDDAATHADVRVPSITSTARMLLASIRSQLRADAVAFEAATADSDSGASLAGILSTSTAAEIRLFDSLRKLPTRMVVRIANVSVVTADEVKLVRGRAISFVLDPRKTQVGFRSGPLEVAAGIRERGIEGRLERSGSNLQIVVRKRRAANEAGGWVARGKLDRSRKEAQLTFEGSSLPQILLPEASRFFVQTQKTSLKAQVDLAAGGRATPPGDPRDSAAVVRTPDAGDVEFRIKADVADARINHPRLGSALIGPFRASVDANGVWQGATGTLTLDSGVITLPDPKDPDEGSVAIAISMDGLKANSEIMGDLSAAETTAPLPEKTTNDRRPIHLWARINQTNCQTLFNAIPQGFAPELGGFTLEGNFAASLEARIDPADPLAMDIRTDDSHWGCRVTEEPAMYSGATLSVPFMLSRGSAATPLPENDPLSAAAVQGSTPQVIGPPSPHFTPLTSMGRNVLTTFVVAEDAGFWTHRGIDKSAITQALRRNLAERRVAIGGSTITMQTVKNLFLTHERTFSRKAQEVFLAWHLEQTLSKERILEIYLNIIEFGPGIHGITDAAAHYFDKHPFDLTIKETTWLASVLPSPVNRHRHYCRGDITPEYDELLSGLLRRMFRLGKISRDSFNTAIAENLAFNPLGRNSTACEEVRPDTAQATESSAEIQ